jgi:hypothetical protein
MAFGIPDDHWHTHGCGCWIQWFPWWIRDNAGQWHVAAFESFMGSQPEPVRFTLSVVPPVPASVTWLDVIISGPSQRARLRLPAEWVAARG